MLVKSSILEALLIILLLYINCVLGHNLEVLILEPLTDLKQSEQRLSAHLLVRVLQEVDDVLRDSHVQAGLDLVRVAGLEDGTDHG